MGTHAEIAHEHAVEKCKTVVRKKRDEFEIKYKRAVKASHYPVHDSKNKLKMDLCDEILEEFEKVWY